MEVPEYFAESSKLLVMPHLHHCDIVHDQAYNFIQSTTISV